MPSVVAGRMKHCPIRHGESVVKTMDGKRANFRIHFLETYAHQTFPNDQSREFPLSV